MPDAGAGPAYGRFRSLGGAADRGLVGRVRIRLAAASDAAALAAIYRPYVTDTAVSFETDAPDEAAMQAWVGSGGDLYPWLVACDEAGALLGYASGSAFRTRPAYRFAVETSVYLAQSAVGRGIGRSLYARLLETLEAQGFAQAIGAITLPNPASVALHDAQAMLRGPSLQARCLECPMPAPVRRRSEPGPLLARLLAALWGA